MDISAATLDYFGRDAVRRLQERLQLVESQVAVATDAVDSTLNVLQDVTRIMRDGHNPSDRIAAALALPYVREDFGRASGKADKLRRERVELTDQLRVFETVARNMSIAAHADSCFNADSALSRRAR